MLDTLGVGDSVRKLAAFQGDATVTRTGGRVIARTASKAMVRRFGDAVIPAIRSSVMDVLTALLAPETFSLGVAATGVEDGVTLAALAGVAKDSAEVASALAQYTALRAPRGADMIRRSHRLGCVR